MSLFFGKNFTKDGHEFHCTGKALVCSIVDFGIPLAELAKLTVKMEWLDLIQPEYRPPNMDFILKLVKDFQAWADDQIVDFTTRKGLQIFAWWMAVLYRMDTNYTNRCPLTDDHSPSPQSPARGAT